MTRNGLYVHIPFCPQRCPYCAFAVETGRMDMVERYVAAVCAEIEASKGSSSWGNLSPFDTVFFGGGTPSRLPPASIAMILETADRVFGLCDGAEITLEANPTTADAAHFSALRDVGVNRLSIGVQSLVDDTLRLLGRTHNAADAKRAYCLARETQFDSINTDLIFSVPAEPLAALTSTIEQMLALEPDHISAYSLTVEENTPFHRRRLLGDLPLVQEDDDAALFLHVRQSLSDSGYEQYEISNFSRSGHRCQHNWDCWTGGEYLGVGLSAHSFAAGQRWWNVLDLDDYCEKVEAGHSARAGCETIDTHRALEERIWLGLRTCEGADLLAAERQIVQGDRQCQQLQKTGRLVLEGHRLRLINEGFAIADAVAACVIDALVKPVMAESRHVHG